LRSCERVLLTATSVVPYLLDQGLVSARAVVEGKLEVSVLDRRNRSFFVRDGVNGGIFLKQARNPDPTGLGTLEREARLYRSLQGRDAGPSTALSALPAIERYDPFRRALALELFADCESVAEHHSRSGDGTGELARSAGALLAALHQELAARMSDAAVVAGLPRARPWMTGLHRTGLAALKTLGAPAAAIADTLSRMPQLIALLSMLEPHWRADTLVHGDLRWDNWLIVRGPGGRQLKVIDWELVDVGDSAFDVGTILKEYLVAALILGPVGTINLWPMRARIRAFLAAYLLARGHASSMEGRSLLARAVAYAGAQLVTAALEYSQGLGQADPLVLQFLALSTAILGQPAWAIRTLFALE